MGNTNTTIKEYDGPMIDEMSVGSCFDYIDLSDVSFIDYVQTHDAFLFIVLRPDFTPRISYCVPRAQLNIRDSVFECVTENRFASVIEDKKYVKLPVGENIYISFEQAKEIRDGISRVFYLKEERELAYTVNWNIYTSWVNNFMYDIVSANHCQAGSGQKLYEVFKCVKDDCVLSKKLEAYMNLKEYLDPYIQLWNEHHIKFTKEKINILYQFFEAYANGTDMQDYINSMSSYDANRINNFIHFMHRNKLPEDKQEFTINIPYVKRLLKWLERKEDHFRPRHSYILRRHGTAT